MNRFLDDVHRTTSSSDAVDTKALLVEQLKITLMEDGLLPAIRLEQIRDEPANSFAQARDRAKRHEANHLSGNNPNPMTYTSAVTFNSRHAQVPRSELEQAQRECQRLRTEVGRHRAGEATLNRTPARSSAGPPPSAMHVDRQSRPHDTSRDSALPSSSTYTIDQQNSVCEYPGCQATTREGHTTQSCLDNPRGARNPQLRRRGRGRGRRVRVRVRDDSESTPGHYGPRP
ncbi:unnamed protein product [Choristocarpus tenellus]